jgi:hypothetical protein
MSVRVYFPEIKGKPGIGILLAHLLTNPAKHLEATDNDNSDITVFATFPSGPVPTFTSSPRADRAHCRFMIL